MGEKQKRIKAAEAAQATAEPGAPVILGKVSVTELNYVRMLTQEAEETKLVTDYLIGTLRGKVAENQRKQGEVRQALLERYALAPSAQINVDLATGEIKLIPPVPAASEVPYDGPGAEPDAPVPPLYPDNMPHEAE
jgi:hypothetical protein